MKKRKYKGFCIIFLVAFCLIASSCELPGNIIQGSSEVDFGAPQRVQITFNEHIYDTTIVLKDKRLEINLTNEKDLLNGAYICLTNSSYKITYKNMAFEGDIAELSSSFLPCVVKAFLHSFEGEIILDSYDKVRQCYYVKKNVNGYFVALECYEYNDNKFYSMEIK